MIIFCRPFERSLPDIEKIFSILQTFDFFKDKIPPKVLRELCVVGVLEQWKEPGFTGLCTLQIRQIFSMLKELNMLIWTFNDIFVENLKFVKIFSRYPHIPSNIFLNLLYCVELTMWWFPNTLYSSMRLIKSVSVSLKNIFYPLPRFSIEKLDKKLHNKSREIYILFTFNIFFWC